MFFFYICHLANSLFPIPVRPSRASEVLQRPPPAPHEVHPEPGRLGPVLRVRLFRRDPAASRQQQPGRLHERPRSRDRFSSGTRLHREHSGKMRVDTNRKFLCHTKKNRDFVFSLTGENDLEGESVTHCDINQLFLEYIFLERRFDS